LEPLKVERIPTQGSIQDQSLEGTKINRSRSHQDLTRVERLKVVPLPGKGEIFPRKAAIQAITSNQAK
jgi:hypothetical protein